MRNDLELHRYLADRQEPVRLPPPQIMMAGDDHYMDVKVVFASSGMKVPWAVTYVNCPERYLMRYSTPRVYYNGNVIKVREDGDFRVDWDK